VIEYDLEDPGDWTLRDVTPPERKFDFGFLPLPSQGGWRFSVMKCFFVSAGGLLEPFSVFRIIGGIERNPRKPFRNSQLGS